MYFLLLWVNQPQPQPSVPASFSALQKQSLKTDISRPEKQENGWWLKSLSALLPFYFAKLVTTHIGKMVWLPKKAGNYLDSSAEIASLGAKRRNQQKIMMDLIVFLSLNLILLAAFKFKYEISPWNQQRIPKWDLWQQSCLGKKAFQRVQVRFHVQQSWQPLALRGE